ncbi:MAG: hypothetical protein ABSD56_02230 [Bryobacteraceae bacterium]
MASAIELHHASGGATAPPSSISLRRMVSTVDGGIHGHAITYASRATPAEASQSLHRSPVAARHAATPSPAANAPIQFVRATAASASAASSHQPGRRFSRATMSASSANGSSVIASTCGPSPYRTSAWRRRPCQIPPTSCRTAGISHADGDVTE